MNVVVVGGNAHSTPQLVANRRLPSEIRLRLVGRTARTLAAVARALKVVAPGIEVECYQNGELRRSLAGADVVLVQLRVGGIGPERGMKCFPIGTGHTGTRDLEPAALRQRGERGRS